MKANFLFYLIGGVVIGFVASVFFYDEPSVMNERAIPSMENFNKINESNALKEIKKIRILCMLNTSPGNHRKSALYIQQTWGKHCDKLVFASTITDVNLNAIGFNLTDKHDFVWGKEKLMMQYVYNTYLDQYDWFYKADDDTFANVENLRFLVAAYSPTDPIYFGYKFATPVHRWGYFSGGSGK